MIAVVANDAGGAEILSSYVRQQHLDCLYVLEGPARKIFERKLGRVETVPLDKALRRATSVLSGTGWHSNLEFEAIKMARSLGKPSVAFLDHWINYRERFIRSGELCLPDEIWVGDPMAEVMAKKIFPGVLIRRKENPYFGDIVEEYAGIEIPPRTARGVSVLYVCEPLRGIALQQFGNERHWGYVEEDALRYFLANVNALGSRVERIVIRPHPSEPVDKYDWARTEIDLPIEAGGRLTQMEEIAECDVVIGCQSMAMVVGLLAGKRVICCIPPEGKPCALPHREIESLQELVHITHVNCKE